jgi:hypothetical protein
MASKSKEIRLEKKRARTAAAWQKRARAGFVLAEE